MPHFILLDFSWHRNLICVSVVIQTKSSRDQILLIILVLIDGTLLFFFNSLWTQRLLLLLRSKLLLPVGGLQIRFIHLRFPIKMIKVTYMLWIRESSSCHWFIRYSSLLRCYFDIIFKSLKWDIWSIFQFWPCLLRTSKAVTLHHVSSVRLSSILRGAQIRFQSLKLFVFCQKCTIGLLDCGRCYMSYLL